MNHSGTFLTPRTPDEVFKLLANPEQFAPLLPDFESAAFLDPTHFSVRIAIALGEMSGHANLAMELVEAERPASVRYRGQGIVAGSQLSLALQFRIASSEGATEVSWQGAPHLTIAVSTSPKLILRLDHEKSVRALKPAFKWDYADTRDATFKLLKESHPHLVYFYCHGGLSRNKPYINVGPDDGPVITQSNLGEKEIEWEAPRPLVFINGCHTTALEPEQAIEFVSSFIRDAKAAGVIGTEITVFESLARAFAEACLRSFIVDGKSIGESIRRARLTLLQAGNPLGLVYVPYVMTGLRLVGE